VAIAAEGPASSAKRIGLMPRGPVICAAIACALAVSAAIPALSAAGWRSAPTVPRLDGPTGSTVASILRRGQRRGERANVFAKVGDSISQSPAFLEGLGCGQLTLAGHGSLGPSVRYFSSRRLAGQSRDCPFANSFSRDSTATQAFAPSGWALAPGASASPACGPGETPLACELRVDRPAYAVILYGTNDVSVGVDIVHADTLPGFLQTMGRIAGETIAAGAVPILSTIPPRIGAAEEAATEHFNAALYRLALRRHIPLINLWRALNRLPNRGLSTDNLHPSLYGGPACIGFCDPTSCAPGCQAANFTSAGLRFGYDVRNLLTLETLARLRALALGLKSPVRGRRFGDHSRDG
jgi:hypothetical protein